MGPRYTAAEAQRLKDEAWLRMVEETCNAWRAPPGVSVTGDPFTDAVLALGERNEIEPLARYLLDAGAGAVPALTIQQMHDLVGILRLLHAKGQKRPPGKPGGTWRRFQNPNYVAAQYAEVRIAIWKRDNGKRNVPNDVRDTIIANTVTELRTWHFAKRQRPSANRVKSILSGPRSRRLPVVLPG
jgi:hypothetical protein